MVEWNGYGNGVDRCMQASTTGAMVPNQMMSPIAPLDGYDGGLLQLD
jgi:hypothetical protein